MITCFLLAREPLISIQMRHNCQHDAAANLILSSQWISYLLLFLLIPNYLHLAGYMSDVLSTNTHTAQYQTVIRSTWTIACRNSEQVLRDAIFTQWESNQYKRTDRWYSQGSDWLGRVTWCFFTPSKSSSAPPLDKIKRDSSICKVWCLWHLDSLLVRVHHQWGQFGQKKMLSFCI